MNPLPQTIDAVIVELDTIIAASIQQGDYLAVFAYVYRRTTAEIKRAIFAGDFEDNARMEKFDVVFANRYIKAYREFASGQATSACWQVAFESKEDPLTILQHLFMGMNAHISFDLGVAAADFAPGDQLALIKNDFMKVNQILADLVEEMQGYISKISGALFLLDWVGGKKDEKIAGFGIRGARQVAWMMARQLAVLKDEERTAKIKQFDQDVAVVNQIIRKPPGRLMTIVLGIIRFFEEKEIGQIIHLIKTEAEKKA